MGPSLPARPLLDIVAGPRLAKEAARLACLFLFAILSLSAPASSRTQSRDAGNPLFPGADPSALYVGGKLWIFPTSATNATRLEAWTDARGAWRLRHIVLRLRDIAWASADGAPRHYLWAPDIHRVGRGYLLYFAIGPQGPTPSRLGVATSKRVDGPYQDSGRPLLTGGPGFEAIDPMMFTDPKTGTPYLYAGGSAGSRLRVFVLKPDRLTIDHEVAVDQPPAFTEAPFMHERDGVYYLSYSHGSWQSSNYSVHYATAPSPTGPWNYRGAILTSDAYHQGPGHHAFVQDPRSGAWYVIYHRWDCAVRSDHLSGQRSVAIEPIHYTPDGLIKPVRMSDRRRTCTSSGKGDPADHRYGHSRSSRRSVPLTILRNSDLTAGSQNSH